MLTLGQSSGASKDLLITQPVPVFNPVATKINSPTLANANTIGCVNRAGQVLFVEYTAGSPYISAKLYTDSERGLNHTYISLTISGALGEALLNSGLYGYLRLVYSTEQDKYYLKSDNASVKKVYPLTLSGTTLTIGTAIDISAAFAGTSATIDMTTDGTDLWFLDTAGVLKKYDLSAGTMSSALSAPSLTGYFTTNVGPWRFDASSGYLWFAGWNSTTVGGAKFTVFQKYNIATDTWSNVPLNAALANVTMSSAQLYFDPDETYFYFSRIESSSTLFYKVTNSEEVTFLFQLGDVSGTGALQGALYSYSYISDFQRCGRLVDFSRNFLFIDDTLNVDVFGVEFSTPITITGAGYVSDLFCLANNCYNSLFASNGGPIENIAIKFSVQT
jgi:hypothetical protein